ncbi:hypothetical protein GCM10025779_14660 [Arthrobacter cryoconiti]
MDFQFHFPDGGLDFSGREKFLGQMRGVAGSYYCERHEIISAVSLIGCRTELGAELHHQYSGASASCWVSGRSAPIKSDATFLHPGFT